MTRDTVLCLDHFAGGVPAGAIFLGNLKNLREMAAGSQRRYEGINPVAEVCLIGLLAYFEAFCKNHFGSLINICPSLIDNLKRRGLEVTVDASHILAFERFTTNCLGFLIAERCDFGTAKSINNHYQDLLNRTPMSVDEVARFDRLVDDRNLLVHHGGLYTARYAGQRFLKKEIQGRVFYDSLVITEAAFLSAAEFLEAIATKTMETTRQALLQFVQEQGLECSAETDKAINALTWSL
jgi:hypothetical protein